MIDRDSWGHSYLTVRGEILGFVKDGLLRKHLPRMFSLIRSRTKIRGSKTIRYRPSLNHSLCRLKIGGRYLYDSFSTLCEIKVFGFRGEYGRKAET